MMVETKKILDPKIKVTATCVRVPVFVGHSEAVNIEFERPITAEEARDILREAPGCLVIDKHEDGGYVTPLRMRRRGRHLHLPHPRGPDDRERPLDVDRLRQSPQGRGAERRADRRAAAEPRADRGEEGGLSARRQWPSGRDLLVTGFGPFPGAPENPTEALVRALAKEPAEAFGASAFKAVVLTTDYRRSWAALRRLYSSFAPDVVVHFGLNGRAEAIHIECVGRNAVDPAKPDASGYAPRLGRPHQGRTRDACLDLSGESNRRGAQDRPAFPSRSPTMPAATSATPRSIARSARRRRRAASASCMCRRSGERADARSPSRRRRHHPAHCRRGSVTVDRLTATGS